MSEQYQKGFFEFIAAADSEKVHSQTIGWIFSKDCDVFESNEKSEILNALLIQKNKKNEDFKPEKVFVEFDDIDILIETKKWLIVIENKIKSSQHSNQLYKYEYITAQNFKTALDCYEKWKLIEFPQDNFKSKFENAQPGGRKKLISTWVSNWDKKDKLKVKDLKTEDIGKTYLEKSSKYIYLTLIKEEPKSKNWIPVTYSTMHSVLSDYFLKKDQKNLQHYAIVKSYLSTIGNLSKIVSDFIDRPSKYEFVFKEGKTKKKDLIIEEKEKGNAKSYIKELQLETLLQKCFYTNLYENLCKSNEELVSSLSDKSISETNGTALLDFIFEKIKISGIEYTPILQFQGNAIKLALAGSKNTEINGVPNLANRKKAFEKRIEKFSEKFNVSSKLSTPKKEDGFLSININNGKGFWQMGENPEMFVTEQIKLAKEFFEGFQVD
ncbi:MAG: hypothetical protein RLZZ358_769 [Bacteroidota bacterium]|jgi:hypothetical protein